MKIRALALNWLEENYPGENHKKKKTIKTSKYFSDEGFWFLTIDTDIFLNNEDLKILLKCPKQPNEFYFLKVPISFFVDNKKLLDIRVMKEKYVFNLYLSASSNNFLARIRSKKRLLNFKKFLQTK